jgi:DNA-binding transcriptional LysR family regulator
MLNPRPVQIFYCVARYGGIGEAARHMRPKISQSAISEQILDLEDRLHVVLFNRRPFALTPAGQRLYEYSKSFFDKLDEVAAELRNGAPDMIRIAASPVVLQDYVPNILRALETQFPKLTFKLRHGLPPQMEKLLEMDEVDVAITVCEGKPPVECVTENLINLPLVLLVPADSLLQSATELWTQDRIAPKLIAPSEDDILTRIFRRGLAELGVDWNVAIDLNNVDVIETFVAKGYGVGLSVVIPGRARPHGLRELPLEGFPTLDISMIWRTHPNPVTLALLVELRKRAKELQKFL